MKTQLESPHKGEITALEFAFTKKIWSGDKEGLICVWDESGTILKQMYNRTKESTISPVVDIKASIDFAFVAGQKTISIYDLLVLILLSCSILH